MGYPAIHYTIDFTMYMHFLCIVFNIVIWKINTNTNTNTSSITLPTRLSRQNNLLSIIAEIRQTYQQMFEQNRITN